MATAGSEDLGAATLSKGHRVVCLDPQIDEHRLLPEIHPSRCPAGHRGVGGHHAIVLRVQNSHSRKSEMVDGRVLHLDHRFWLFLCSGRFAAGRGVGRSVYSSTRGRSSDCDARHGLDRVCLTGTTVGEPVDDHRVRIRRAVLHRRDDRLVVRHFHGRQLAGDCRHAIHRLHGATQSLPHQRHQAGLVDGRSSGFRTNLSRGRRGTGWVSNAHSLD